MSTPLRLVRTAGAARLAVLAVATVIAALVVGRPTMLVLCAPPLLLLALGQRRSTSGTAGTAGTAALSVRLDPPRAVEGDEVRVHVEVRLSRPTIGAEVRLRTALPTDPDDPLVRTDGGTDRFVATFTVRPDRWGRWSVGTARLALLSEGGLDRADLYASLGDLVVYPRTVPLRSAPRPARLPQLVGEHVVASKGSGVEFADIRPYVPGDPVRTVHWAATARHGRPYVVERHVERLADVVLLIDAALDVGPPGNSSLDVAVRAACSLASSSLAAGDRVGVVALGGSLRWLPVGLGARYLYRITDAVVEVRRDAATVAGAGLSRVPPAALPPGALVVVFTPLLDPSIIRVIARLSERGMSTLVLDTLTAEPVVDSGFPGPLALRVWRRERADLLEQLAALGAMVLPAHDLSTLDASLAPVRRYRPAGRTR